MPPRKVKADPEVIRIAENVSEQSLIFINNFKETVEELVMAHSDRKIKSILEQISDDVRQMNFFDFMNDPSASLFSTKPTVVEEAIKEEESIGDVAHETDIPVLHPEVQSGRNTATDATRHELITPSGHVMPIPTIDPAKAFRIRRPSEEIGFSANGTPLLLTGKQTAKKNLAPLKAPKLEDPDMSIED